MLPILVMPAPIPSAISNGSGYPLRHYLLHMEDGCCGEYIDHIDHTGRYKDRNSSRDSYGNGNRDGSRVKNRSRDICDGSDVNNSKNNGKKVKSSKIHAPYRSSTLDDLSRKCRLFREFSAGSVKLSDSELMGIATNMLQVEAGPSRFKEILADNIALYRDSRSSTAQAENKYRQWAYYLKHFKQSDYKSQSCVTFCRYQDDCSHGVSPLSTVKTKRGTIERLANYHKVTDGKTADGTVFDNRTTNGKESDGKTTNENLAANRNLATNGKLANEFVAIEEARKDMERIFNIAIEASNAKIYAINAPIGIGKSTMVLYFLKTTKLRCLFVFPSNDLKNELYEKALLMGINAVKSPSLLEHKDILPKEVWKRIESLYNRGKAHGVTAYIKEVIRKGTVSNGTVGNGTAGKEKISKSALDILKNYLRDLSEFYTSDCHGFTTHSRLQTMDSWTLKKYDVVIIDEDPILNCFLPSQTEIPISKLTEVLEHIDINSELAKKIVKAAEAAKTKELFTLKSIRYDNAYDNIPIGVDISSFCHTEKFCCRKKGMGQNLYESNSSEDSCNESNPNEDSIVFLKPLKFYPNIKYIILSATINEKISNYCFGSDRVAFHRCKRARYQGTLNQYTGKTMSRSNISKDPGVIDRIVKATDIENVVTFKKYGYGQDGEHSHYGQNRGRAYYGKTTGIDTLKGTDLNVIGTPHYPPFIYKLFAYTLGLIFDEKASISNRPIRHNGCSSWFMTFCADNWVLRDVQFYMIESELEQAVGRARLINNDCTVNLFSNYPLGQGLMKEIDLDY